MPSFLGTILTYIRTYFNSLQEKKREELLEQVQNTEEEKHISGAKNILMQYEQKSPPKTSNMHLPKK